MTRLQRFLLVLGFNEYKWFRRWCGGHWEFWQSLWHDGKWSPSTTSDEFEAHMRDHYACHKLGTEDYTHKEKQ